jgi:hypothetical protein
MKILFFLLFALSSLFVCSQTKINGRVFDKEPQKPVSGVIIYSGEYRNITMSDEDGNYYLEANAGDTVHFTHLAYKPVSSDADILIKNPDVYLTPYIVELNEVVVSPIQVESFLKKAFNNLLNRYLKNESISYLLNIESNTSSGGARELYALLNVSRVHNNYKQKVYLNTYLAELDIVESMNNSDFFIKNILVYTEFFPSNFGVDIDLKNYHYQLSENSDGSEIIIKVIPKNPGRKRYRYTLYTVNRSDTVLVEYTGQSFSNAQDLTAYKIKGVPYQVLSHHSYVKFKRTDDSQAYYIEKCQNISTRKIGSDPSYTVLSKATTFKIDKANNPQPESKKINTSDYQLFESNFPQTPGFWKQYIK